MEKAEAMQLQEEIVEAGIFEFDQELHDKKIYEAGLMNGTKKWKDRRYSMFIERKRLFRQK